MIYEGFKSKSCWPGILHRKLVHSTSCQHALTLTKLSRVVEARTHTYAAACLAADLKTTLRVL